MGYSIGHEPGGSMLLRLPADLVEASERNARYAGVNRPRYVRGSHNLYRAIGGLGIGPESRIGTAHGLYPFPALSVPPDPHSRQKEYHIQLAPSVLLESKEKRVREGWTLKQYLERALRLMNYMFEIGAGDEISLQGITAPYHPGYIKLPFTAALPEGPVSSPPMSHGDWRAQR